METCSRRPQRSRFSQTLCRLVFCRIWYQHELGQATLPTMALEISIRSTGVKDWSVLPFSSCFDIWLAYHFWKRSFNLSLTIFCTVKSIGCSRSVQLGSMNTIHIPFFFKSFIKSFPIYALKTSKMHNAFCESGSPRRFFVRRMWGMRIFAVYSICLVLLAQWFGLCVICQARGKSYAWWQAEVVPL